MTPDLPSLVAPLTEAEFMTRLRERTLTFVPGSGRNRWETLLDWDTLDHLLEASRYPLERLRVLKESTPIPASFYTKDGQFDPAALAKLVDQGVSMILNRLDEYVPKLRQLCRDIAARTRERSSAEAVYTSGRGGALQLHFDPEDIAVLQVAGTKRWQIHGATINHPVKWTPEIPPPQGPPVFDKVLQPGDFLLLPAGHWHHCENGPERSLHLTILFIPPNGRHLMTSLATKWLADPTFRQPLTRHANAEELSAREAALKARLIEKIQALSLPDFLAEVEPAPPAKKISMKGAPISSRRM